LKFYYIDELDKYGVSTALFTSGDTGNWDCGCKEGLMAYEEVAKECKIDIGRMVATYNQHTSVVRKVTAEDGGDNVIKSSYPDQPVDGLITNEKGLMLCTESSDCVPVFLLDIETPAVGMIHCGWKGTAQEITVNEIRMMHDEYGSKPENILVAFGPCICGNCYEVRDDIKERFTKNFSSDEIDCFLKRRDESIYLMDLKKAVSISLQRIGIDRNHIFDSGHCTYESENLFSFRRFRKTGCPNGDNFSGIMLK
jgi:polyphenol oxidase